MEPELSKIIEESVDNSVQQGTMKASGGGVFLMQSLVRAGINFAPWWSPARDAQLREFVKKVDYLSGAVYTMEAKMSSIPFSVQARDQANKEHVAQAREFTQKLSGAAEFGGGWTTFYEKFVENLLTQDNGVFVEIIGRGAVDGPIVGAPITIKVLDSGRCQRTGHPIYPVIYEDTDGKRYKFHYSRIMFRSQMESTEADMFGIGFCAVSRVINVAQTLYDQLVYKQEKMGSRPHRGVIVTKGGLDPLDVKSAFDIIESDLDAQSLSRYSKFAIVGNSGLPEADMDVKELSGMPDGFDERDSVTLGIATIALAFGVDARELFPALSSGATRADALLQHLKQRGKGPGQILQLTEELFNQKFLPPHLKLVFDFQDDEEDRQAADTKLTRMQRWNTAIGSGAMDIHCVREQMVLAGDLERSQFEQLELKDGRLPDGTSVVALFYSDDPTMKSMLDLGIGDVDPYDMELNDPATLLPAVHRKIAEANRIIVNSNTHDERWTAQQAIAALETLEDHYLEAEIQAQAQAQMQANASAGAPAPGNGKANTDPTANGPQKDFRMRKQSPLTNSRVSIRMDNEHLVPDASDDRIKALVEMAGADTYPFWSSKEWEAET